MCYLDFYLNLSCNYLTRLSFQVPPILSSTPQDSSLQVAAQVHRNGHSPESSDSELDTAAAAAEGPAHDDADFHSMASLETTLLEGQDEGQLMAGLRQGMDQLSLVSQGVHPATGARPRVMAQDHIYDVADHQVGQYQNTSQVEERPPVPARRQLPGVQTYHLPGDPRTQVTVNVYQPAPVPPPRRARPDDEEGVEEDPLNRTLSHAQVLRINARRLRRDAIDLANKAADFILFTRRPR